MIILITESSSFILSQTDLSVKVKGQTNKSRQIDKRTGTNRETCNTFTDFIRRCKVADKWVLVVDKSKEICTLWRRSVHMKTCTRFTGEIVHIRFSATWKCIVPLPSFVYPEFWNVFPTRSRPEIRLCIMQVTINIALCIKHW